MMVVNVEGPLNGIGYVLDGWLAENGFPGCMVTTQGGQVNIMWNARGLFDEEAMRKAIVAATSAVRMA